MEPPGSHPINQKAAADFARCGFSFTPSERIRRAAGEIGAQACRCFIVAFFACFVFRFVYLCIYYPFCISFIGYLPLFGNQTDLFSQKNPAFLPYKRLPLQHFHLPALTSAQLHATPLSAYCRFRPAFQARSVLFYLKYTNRKAKCRQFPVFSLKESWFIPSLLYLSLQVFVYVSFYF